MAGAAAEEIKEALETQPTDNENPFEGMDEAELARMRGDVVDEATETEDQIETAPEPEPQPEEAADFEPEPQPEEAKSNTTEEEGDRDSAIQGDDESTTPEPAPVMLPKSRFDAVNQRYREEQARREALEARLAEMEKQTGVQEVDNTPQQDAQLAEIDKQIAEALADGEVDKVASLMGQQRALQSQIFESKLAAANTTASAQTIENMKFDLLLDQVESVRPELKVGAEEYDEAKSIETVELVEAFQARGYNLPDALERALGYVYPEGWRNAQQSTQTTSEAPAPAPAPEKKQTDTQKNLTAMKSQPPAMKAGEPSSAAGLQTKINPMDLSDDEFSKLTEAELAELRGDNF